MPESWRTDIANMQNRNLIFVVVLISVLLHLGLALLFWKTNALDMPRTKNEPIFVDMVQAPPSDSSTGTIVDKSLPANNVRSDRANIIARRENRVEKETHIRDVPINNDTRDVGSRGAGGRSSISKDSGTGHRPGSGTSDDSKEGSSGAKSSNDLISSVSYGTSPNKGNKGSRAGGRGNLSPYNPKIGSPGNAININTKSFKYVSYFASIKEKIEWAWVYPQSAQKSGQQGTLSVTFTILRDGSLKEVKLIRSSGFRVLDQAALRAVKDAASFPPMPAGWEDNELTILANFEYRLIGTKSVF